MGKVNTEEMNMELTQFFKSALDEDRSPVVWSMGDCCQMLLPWQIFKAAFKFGPILLMG